jgi:hypothetical protein
MIFLLYLSIPIGIDPVETNEALESKFGRLFFGSRLQRIGLVLIWRSREVSAQVNQISGNGFSGLDTREPTRRETKLAGDEEPGVGTQPHHRELRRRGHPLRRRHGHQRAKTRRP